MKRKILFALLAILLAIGAFTLFRPAGVYALDPGLYVVTIPDNPSCATLNAFTDPEFAGITSNFGFKLDGGPTGTFPLSTVPPNELTGGAPDDPLNSITTTVYDSAMGQLLDWAATLGIDAVIVKGGSDANAYVYLPEVYGDTGLHAPLNTSNNKYYNISHIEFCYDYELTATKSAHAVWYKTIDWTVAKSVTPTSLNLFAGQSADFDYNVSVTKTETFGPYAVSGHITVTNPTSFGTLFTVTDMVDGVPAVVDCPTNIILANDYAPGGLDEVTCTYSASLASNTNGTNTATITTDLAFNPYVGGTTATAGYTFGDPLLSAGSEPESITVDDTNGQSWSTGASASWDYSAPQACSGDQGLYDKGLYTGIFENVATINETGETDRATATVTLHCFAPTVKKTAQTEWFREYEWEITKSVAPASHVGFPGDSFTSDYDVFVHRIFNDSGFRAFGNITVVNPAGSPGSMTINVSDAVDGVTAVVNCGGGSTSLTVAPGNSGVCSYTVNLDSAAERSNTATATFNGYPFTYSVPVVFGDPQVTGYPTIHVTDYFDGDTSGDPLGSASADHTFEYDRTFDCPTDKTLYSSTGIYTDSFPNDAEIDETGQQDDAEVDITCYLPGKAKVLKTTTEGPEDIGQFPFTFKLYDPSGALVETVTLNAAGGFAFNTPLVAVGTWTVEEVLPAGWVSTTPLTCTFNVAFPASAGKTYACIFDNKEKGRVDLLKLTDGVQNGSMTWSFKLFQGSTEIASDSTPPPLLDFGNVDLNPFLTYRLCEVGIPSGWTSQWALDSNSNGVIDPGETLPFVGGQVNLTGSGLFQVFDPDPNYGQPGAVNDTRCVNFVPKIGETTHFIVDNQHPGGEPRTPGYWKNWNTCTNGNQQNVAAKNGGPSAGWYLLDDLIPTTVGDLLVPDCDTGVSVLDQRDLASGRKRASDAAYTLAMHLLAAKLNLSAGAETCSAVVQAVADGQALLESIDFVGEGQYLRPKDALYQSALDLASTLDQYNNGNLCP